MEFIRYLHESSVIEFYSNTGNSVCIYPLVKTIEKFLDNLTSDPKYHGTYNIFRIEIHGKFGTMWDSVHEVALRDESLPDGILNTV